MASNLMVFRGAAGVQPEHTEKCLKAKAVTKSNGKKLKRQKAWLKAKEMAKSISKIKNLNRGPLVELTRNDPSIKISEYLV